MKRTKICLLLVMLLAASAPSATPKTLSRMKELKLLQKSARKRLKLQQKAWKRSFHGRRIPRVERVAAQRQYRIYMRTLRTQQRQEVKQLRQQIRLQKAARNTPL
jgi:hypothetical protein